ncbi:MAG: GAF and ANTAR domain-containing protein [Acidimicrobiales bacterium]
MKREELLSETFVSLADTLVDDFDVIEFLSLLCERCVELFDAEAAGVMLAGAPGDVLQLMASSSERMRLIELFEIQGDEGPCPDCYRTGKAVGEADLEATAVRWPAFSVEALGAGFRAVYALPMRVRGEVVGALNLFRNQVGALPEADLRAAQALADVATLGILQHRIQSDSRSLSEQLQHALNSRVVIEQAKGMVAERSKIGMDEAFSVLRNYARHHNRHLSDVARDVTDGTLPADALAKTGGSTGRRMSA